MIVSYNWLKELVKLNVSAEKLAEEMSLYSIEVESFKKLVEATNLVVGYVTDKKPHENSDHLNICQVNFGDYDLQIVCGAPNVAVGQKVIVALPGAVLPGGTIKKSSIRGVESNGMICSLQELGLDAKYVPQEYQHGIYVLGEDAVPGTSALEYLCLDDYVIELGLTPNRMDLLSMNGVANDMVAMYNSERLPLEYELHEIDKEAKDEISVKLETTNCYSYYARVIEDVEIKESPAFIKARLIASGIRPINNVVDITNYILMLFGQPLHSFDKDLLGNKIVVRRANEGEKTITLDNIERTLNHSDIVITDGEKPVCIAGVMGSSNTEVTNNTKNIVLESAVFRPLSIRKTSSRLGLRSEASVRYERGVDLNQTLDAVNYACYLLEKYAGGKVLKGYVHEGKEHIDDKEIIITKKFVDEYLGIEIKEEKIVSILESLGFKVEKDNKELKVYVPNRRLDITIKQDLVEEIARINGYDKIAPTLPNKTQSPEVTKEQKLLKAVNNLFLGYGFNEAMTSSLIGEPLLKQFGLSYNKEEAVFVQNPQSEDHTMLRQTTIANILSTLKYNFDNGQKNIWLYEMGKTYFIKQAATEKDSGVEENQVVSGVITGDTNTNLWKKTQKVDFYTLKGVLESLFELLGLSNRVKLNPANDCEYLHPGRSAKVVLLGKTPETIGYFGEIYPIIKDKLKINQEIFLFEINLGKLIQAANVNVVKYKQLPQFPEVQRDISFAIEKNVSNEQILLAIKKSADSKLFKGANLFDIYEGEHIQEGYKSLAYRITIQDEEATLTDEIIEKQIAGIKSGLIKKFPTVSFR